MILLGVLNHLTNLRRDHVYQRQIIISGYLQNKYILMCISVFALQKYKKLKIKSALERLKVKNNSITFLLKIKYVTVSAGAQT